jgi:hypothetical protein
MYIRYISPQINDWIDILAYKRFMFVTKQARLDTPRISPIPFEFYTAAEISFIGNVIATQRPRIEKSLDRHY